MLKLWIETYARNTDIFMNLCTVIVFRFQLHIENSSQELGLGPALFSISLLRVIRIEHTQIWLIDGANNKVYIPLHTNELMFLIFLIKTYKVDDLKLITS